MSTAKLNLFLVIVFGLTLPVSVVLSTHLARRSFEKVKLRDQTITVKGYAERRIVSDRASWTAQITERRPELAAAYADLEKHRQALLDLLGRCAFAPELVELSPVQIQTQHPRDEEGHPLNRIEGYVVSQYFSIASPDVQAVARAAREASNLIKDGIELDAGAAEYLYTKLDDLKLQLLGEATLNARQRAEQLVSHSTSSLGPLRSASQGVFQITPAYSTEVTDSGINDTSSIDKIIKAVVTVEYAIR